MEIPGIIQECLDKIKALQGQIKELEKEIDAYSDGYIYIVHHTFMGIPSLNFLNNR